MAPTNHSDGGSGHRGGQRISCTGDGVRGGGGGRGCDASVMSRVQQVATRSGRAQESMRVVAVSKTKPVGVICGVYDADHRCFGENYVQELIGKAPQHFPLIMFRRCQTAVVVCQITVPGKYIGLDLVTSAHMSTDLPFFPSPPSPTHPRTVARRHLGGVLRHLGAME